MQTGRLKDSLRPDESNGLTLELKTSMQNGVRERVPMDRALIVQVGESGQARLLVLIALVGGVLTAVPAATARVSVLHGSTYRARIFPDDFFSVRDTGNITRKRVNFRKGIDYPACNSSNYSICDGFAMLNTLDGFDLQPRVTVPFSGPISVGSVNLSNFYVRGAGGRTGLSQWVWAPATKTL